MPALQMCVLFGQKTAIVCHCSLGNGRTSLFERSFSGWKGHSFSISQVGPTPSPQSQLSISSDFALFGLTLLSPHRIISANSNRFWCRTFNFWPGFGDSEATTKLSLLWDEPWYKEVPEVLSSNSIDSAIPPVSAKFSSSKVFERVHVVSIVCC